MVQLFAGLDVSTQSCKLVVIDYKSKKVVFTHTIIYDDMPDYHTKNGVIQGLPEGSSESEPNMWIEAVEKTFQEMKNAKIPIQAIQCISVSGQQHGLVTLDEDGKLTRPTSKLWNDFSTQEECELLTKAVNGPEAMIAEVGNTQRTGYTASKIFHMYRHERERYNRTSTFFLVHNYINWYLTGGVRIMEPGDTSGMALWNPKNGQWSRKVIETIDPGLVRKLPPVSTSTSSIGFISKSLVEKYGFSEQCKIDAGSGDNMYGAIGTGNVKPDIVTISLGTSGTVYMFMKKPFIDPEGEIAAFCDSTGHYLPLLCVSNLANGYNAVLEQYNMDHQDFNDTINKTRPGNSGKILLPWFIGERTPDLPLAAPVFFGFQLDDFNKETICRAVLEGHVLNLYQGYKKMQTSAREVRLTGGLSRSVIWTQTIANIFGSEVVPVKGEGAAQGAAMHAAWVWMNEAGNSISIDDICQEFVQVDEERRMKPQAELTGIYNILKQLFEAVSLRFRGRNGEDPFIIRDRLQRSH